MSVYARLLAITALPALAAVLPLAPGRAGAAQDPVASPAGAPERLIPLLSDPVAGVADAAADALVAIGEPALHGIGAFLLSEPLLSPGKGRAARVLGRMGRPAAIPYLSETLVRTRTGWRGSGDAFDALAAVGPASTRALLGLLRHPELREGSYLTILRLPPAAVEEALLTILFDAAEDPAFRRQVAAETETILGTAASWLALAGFYDRLSRDAALSAEERTAARLEMERLLAGEAAGRRPPLDAAQVRAWGEQRARQLEQEASREEAAREEALEARRRGHAEMNGLRQAAEAWTRRSAQDEDIFRELDQGRNTGGPARTQAPAPPVDWKIMRFPACPRQGRDGRTHDPEGP